MDGKAPLPWPHSLTLLRPRLEQLRFPDGPFDPEGAWEHRYSVLVVGNILKRPAHHYPCGTLRLKRAAAIDTPKQEVWGCHPRRRDAWGCHPRRWNTSSMGRSADSFARDRLKAALRTGSARTARIPANHLSL